jgi:hypothetical protein
MYIRRFGYAPPPDGRLRGYVRLGRYAPTAHSTHIFAGLQTYGLLIRPAKTSYTAETLGAINPKLVKIE